MRLTPEIVQLPYRFNNIRIKHLEVVSTIGVRLTVHPNSYYYLRPDFRSQTAAI